MDDIIDPNAPKEVAMTSLDWCARSRQLGLLNTVLSTHFSHGAISDLEPECSHVLRNAVTSGCKDTVTSLLRHVDDAFLQQRQPPDVTNSRTRLNKLLGLSVHYGYREVTEVLLKKGADANITYRNKPLLHLSLSQGHFGIVRLLVKYGAHINIMNSKEESPLFAVLSSGCHEMDEIMDDLIERGTDVNHRSLTGRQPIHCAAVITNIRALKRLAEAGCDVGARDNVMGDTPLHLACSRCCKEAVVTLVRLGADFNPVNHHGDTPLRKLLQHTTRLSRDFHYKTRVKFARALVALGFRLHPPSSPSPAHLSSSLTTAAFGINNTKDQYSLSLPRDNQTPNTSQKQISEKPPREDPPDPKISNENRNFDEKRADLFAARGDCRKGSRGPGRDKVMDVYLNLRSEGKLQVSGLQHLCRMELRRNLPKVHFQESVRTLEISGHLQQYLMFLPHLFDDTL